MPRIIRWVSIVVIALLLLLGGSVFYLCGTQSGTRWLLGMAQPYLPEQLDTGSVSGTLLGGLQADGLRWSDASVQVSVQRLELAVELRPLFSRRVSVRNLDARGIDVTLIQSADEPEPGGPFAVDVPLTIALQDSLLQDITITRDAFVRRIDGVRLIAGLQGSQLSVSRFDINSDWLVTSLAGKGRLQTPYPVELALSWKYAGDTGAGYEGALNISGRIDDYALEHRLVAPFVVETRGTVAFKDGALEGDLTNRWDSISITAGRNSIVSRDGRLRFVGNTSQYRTSGDALLQLNDWPVSHLDLDGEGNLDGLRIATMQVESDLGQLSASGEVLWQPALSWDLQFDASGLDPAQASDALQGALNAAGTSVGRIAGGEPRFRVDLLRIDGTLNDEPVAGKAAATVNGTTVDVEDADIRIGENRINATGRVHEDVDLDVVLRIPRIGTLVDEASGQLQADLSLRRVAGIVSISGSASGTALTWREFRADSLSARGRLAENGAVDATIEAISPAYGPYLADTATIEVQGRSERHTLQAQIRAPGNALELEARGSLADREWDGEIRSVRLTADKAGDWTASQSAKLRLAAGSLSLERLCIDSAVTDGKACIAASWADDAALGFDVSIEEFPLTSLPLPLLPGVEVAGAIQVAARGELESKRLNGSASIDVADAIFSADYEGEKIVATFEEGILDATVTDNRLDAGLRVHLSDEFGDVEGTLDMSDVFDPGSAVTGSVTLNVEDLSIFPILLPSVTDTSGRIDGSVAISGTASQPQLIGAVALRDGAFAVRRAGIAVTDVNVELRQRGAGRLGISGSAHSGEGSVTIDGSTDVAAGSELRAQIDINGDNFEIVRLPDWRVSASPAISVALDSKKARVSGDILIPTANLVLNTIPETAEQSSPDAVVHLAETTDETPRRRIDVDVNARLGEDVRVQAFGLATGLEGAVNIKGGTHAPYIGSGRLRLRDGRFEAYGQSLQIESGELIFNGPLDSPNLDVRAVRPTRDVVAGVHLTGTPRQLSSTVFSEPPLGDAEALSYLLTGRPLASATSGEGEMLNNAAFALGLSQAGAIASQIQGELGLDTLTIAGGAEESEIVAGKQINDRLFVEYGYGLVNNLGRLLLRYQLSQRLVVESTSGVTNTVDLVYSVKKQ